MVNQSSPLLTQPVHSVWCVRIFSDQVRLPGVDRHVFLCLQASFVATGNRTDISLEDPDFWQKWAKKAELDLDAINGRVIRTHKRKHTEQICNVNPTQERQTWCSCQATEREQSHHASKYLGAYEVSHVHTLSGLSLLKGDQQWDIVGGGVKQTERERERTGGKQREREINIDSWESPLFLNYPCFPALMCVCLSERE